MSKLSFRARQVDYTKPLPIYLNNDLPDLQDFAAINRSVPLMPTGMEKDEEAEHHLQRALSALQAFGATSSNEYAIPTPKVEIDNKMYERIYNVECPKQKTYIRIQPFSNDYDYPDYDADYEDESWLNDKKKTLPKELLNNNQDLLLFFETIMDRLEKVTSHSNVLMSREEAKILLMKEAMNDESNDLLNTLSLSNTIVKQQQKYKEELEDFLLSIYEYWKAKRLKCNHPLTPIVLTDKSGVVTQPNNPYLVFRRRTEKMQTRKNRKNEEQSYEKMLILKRDLCRAQQILKLIKKRENFKKEFLKLTLETFEKRYKLNDYDGTLTETIACSLKPQQQQQLQPNSQQQQQVNSFNTLSSNSSFNKNDKTNSSNNNNNNNNLSSIDKTIVNLIHSNKVKSLSSPPHSSLVASKHNSTKLPQLQDLDSIYKSNTLTSTSSLNSKLCKQLSEKQQQKRLKKEKLQQQTSVSSQQQNNTISNLINSNNNNNKKYYGDIIESKLDANNTKQITVNNSNNSNTTPLTNRSNSNLSVLNDPRRRHNNRKLLNSSSLTTSNNSDNNNSRYSLNENENLDSNNNKNSRNLNFNNNLIQQNLKQNQTLNQQQLLLQQQQQQQQQAPKLDTETLTSRLLSEDENLSAIINEFKEYEEELRQNQIENLDSILNEAKNRLSTTSEKDGYWCFKRKEGCKYLPQNGPIFKNDAEDFLKPLQPPPPHHLLSNSSADTASTNTEEIVNTTTTTTTNFYPNNKKQKRLDLKKKDRLKELQQFYYGYAITKHNRHLGLVRRRLGRGGRILLDKYNENLFNKNNVKKLNDSKFVSLSLNKFKTYYPIECFNLADKHNDSSSNSTNSTNNNNTNSSSETKTKLKLKNFYADSSPVLMNDDPVGETTKLIEENHDEFTFDHRLFSLYQFESDYFLDNELMNMRDDSTSANITNEEPQQQQQQQVTITNESLVNANNNQSKSLPNDYDSSEYDTCSYFLNNAEATNSKIYDRTNLIRYDFSSHTKLNDEYNSSSDECNLNLSNVKQAIKTLKILNNKQEKLSESPQEVDMQPPPPPPLPPLDTAKTNELTIETLKTETIDETVLTSRDDLLEMTKMNDEDKKNLGESIANIASTTLTPPSPSPPLPSDSNSTSFFSSINNKEINIVNVTPIYNETNNKPSNNNNNNESINNTNENSNEINLNNNNNNSSNINFTITNNNSNKILLSLPNNSTTTTNTTTTTTSPLFNQTQTSRYFQPINKIKNLNEKIMQPLVNGTSAATTTSSSSSPSSSLSPQTHYQVKKQVKLNSTSSSTNNNTTNSSLNAKGSSFLYSTSSLPSSSSQSSSSSSSSSSSPHSLSTIVITPSSKLATSTSSTNLVSINSIQTTNSNQINSTSSTNSTIVVNGLLAKKKDENNPFILNNNTNYQNFHHQDQNQLITSSSITQTNQALNTTSNGLSIPTQKLLHFSTTFPSNSSSMMNSNNLVFKQTNTNTTNATSLIASPLQVPISLTSATLAASTTASTTNDLNNSTKII